jgi:trigger factor
VSDRKVSREALEAEIESTDTGEGGHVHGPGCGHDHGGETKPKKGAAKKAAPARAEAAEKPAKKAAAKAQPAEKPAKKAPAKKPAAKKA